ncbi:MAG TPA: ATP-binding cassette domain-containing protein [Solirubrobacteraceae bacterium]|jgi:ABC-type lipoprotein export system ATPase subunit|nr:ATP-binding cassette domain-containing protein [Solirubrobacteraceae bacterium]
MTALLRIRDVSKAYPDGAGRVAVFDNASLELTAGSHVGVYGRRRSGKSTLMRIAAGIERPDTGSVVFDGQDLTCISSIEHARLLRSRLSYIAVNDWRPNPGESVVQHLAVSLGGDGRTVRQAERRILRELDLVGVGAGQAHSLASRLSMVDRTRVMLARALAREPKLIVIDDPVITPSTLERDCLYRLLRTLARERGAALLVTSDDLPGLQGFDVLMSISARELCSSETNATVVPFPSPSQLPPVRDTGS